MKEQHYDLQVCFADKYWWLASYKMTLAVSFCVGQMNSLLHKAYRGGSPVDAAEAGVSGLDYHGRLQQLIYLLTN